VICLMASGAYATIHATATGNWTDTSVWSGSYGIPINDGDEVKIGSATGLTVTVNSDVGTYSTKKINTSSDCTLVVASGGWLGNGREINVGAGPAYGAGLSDVGYLNQTGGTIDISRSGKLNLAYRSSGTVDTAGTYTISGGTLQGTATASINVGCSSGDGMTGTFKVVGTGGTINFSGAMYVANSSSTTSAHTGTGNIEFDLNASGQVSAIKVLKSIIDSQNGLESAVANLIVDATAGVPTGDLLLIRNTGTDDVVGNFTTLNGIATTQVMFGGTKFYLTYTYDADGDNEDNDIALLIPEPATIALLGLGLLVIRRNKK